MKHDNSMSAEDWQLLGWMRLREKMSRRRAAGLIAELHDAIAYYEQRLAISANQMERNMIRQQISNRREQKRWAETFLQTSNPSK